MALWWLTTAPAFSDIVELRGGRTLEGIVIEETPDVVILDIGMGQMSFTGDQVVEIIRSSESDNLDTRQAWTLRYIAESDLPEDLRPLYREWDRLQVIRKRARDGARGLASTVRDQAHLQRSIQSTRTALTKMGQEIAATPMQRDVGAYNAKVQRNNEWVAKLNQQQAALQAAEDRQIRMRENIARYAGELTRYENRFRSIARAHGNPEADAVARAWVERTENRLADLVKDFSQFSVPISGTPGGTLLEVTLNDRETGRFILDTGASIVTLTETLARKLKLHYNPDQAIPLRLADGKTTEGYPVVLDAVSVGDARAENVGAVVVPGDPAPGVEGLLGMSFLGRFEMNFDAAAGRLVLRKLRAP